MEAMAIHFVDLITTPTGDIVICELEQKHYCYMRQCGNSYQCKWEKKEVLNKINYYFSTCGYSL